MRKIRAIIIDDEELARRVIRKHLENHTDIEVVKECQNGFEGIKAINSLKPDLIFLDIQMPKLTGFEMLELLEKPPVVIFVTAYDQYAIQAFEASAVDYLLKPFDAVRFNICLKKARHFLTEPGQENESAQKIHQRQISSHESLRRIVLKHKNGVVVIPIENILRIEAQGDYVLLQTEDSRYLKHQTLGFYEKHLPSSDFIRLHRAHLVKLACIHRIEQVRRGSYQAILKDETVLPVSRSGYQRFRDITSK